MGAWSSSSSPDGPSARGITAAPRAAWSCWSGRSPDRAGARVLDIGTGSGILAVAAVKLGAISVLGIDVDPDATSAAQTNAERNGCADRIEIALAGPETLTGEAFPVAVANLLTHTHLALAPIYARLVAPGGALVLGGILAEEDPQVTGAVEAVGFIQRDRLVLEGWSSLRLDRLPASRP